MIQWTELLLRYWFYLCNLPLSVIRTLIYAKSYLFVTNYCSNSLQCRMVMLVNISFPCCWFTWYNKPSVSIEKDFEGIIFYFPYWNIRNDQSKTEIEVELSSTWTVIRVILFFILVWTTSYIRFMFVSSEMCCNIALVNTSKLSVTWLAFQFTIVTIQHIFTKFPY